MSPPGDYRAVLSAVNALGANQREHSLRLTAVETGLGEVRAEVADLRQDTHGQASGRSRSTSPNSKI